MNPVMRRYRNSYLALLAGGDGVADTCTAGSRRCEAPATVLAPSRVRSPVGPAPEPDRRRSNLARRAPGICRTGARTAGGGDHHDHPHHSTSEAAGYQ